MDYEEYENYVKGNLLKVIREKYWSVSEASRRTNIDKACFFAFFHKKSGTNVPTLYRYARKIGVSLLCLLEGVEDYTLPIKGPKYKNTLKYVKKIKDSKKRRSYYMCVKNAIYGTSKGLKLKTVWDISSIVGEDVSVILGLRRKDEKRDV